MLRLVYDNNNMDADFSCSEAGTETTNAIETAVILSIFCDARADVGDNITEATDRRGWWAEAYFDAPDTWGSKLWQVLTRKATNSALVDAQRAVEASLQWLIDDGVAREIEVETWWIEGRQGYMGILVKVLKPKDVSPQYVGPWSIWYAVE